MSAAEREPAPVARRAESDDEALLDRLLDGDEAAFSVLVTRHHAAMVAVATLFLPSRGLAEEVVQDTWLAVLNGLDRFEGRSSLRTWLFAILANRARSRSRREARTLPLSSIVQQEVVANEPVADDALFSDDPGSWRGHWTTHPRPWVGDLADQLVGAEAAAEVFTAIDLLPPAQRAVILLRDVHGWAADEVCETLGVTDGNQRVLLHRARARVRDAIRRYLDAD